MSISRNGIININRSLVKGTSI